MDYSVYKDDVKQREDITVGEQRAYIKYLNSHKRKHSMNRMANSRDTETGRVYKAERAWRTEKHAGRDHDCIQEGIAVPVREVC